MSTETIVYEALLRVFGSTEEIERSKVLDRPFDAAFRRELAEVDMMFFAQYYLADHFQSEPAPMHQRLAKEFPDWITADGRGYKLVLWPRGFAKTTWAALVTPLWSVVFCKRHYIVLMSDSLDQAKSYLETLKDQFETNERIIEDFGLLRGKTWKTDEIRCLPSYAANLTPTGVDENGNPVVRVKQSDTIFVKALGTRQKIRGRKTKQYRPDLILMDDVENTIAVRSEMQRGTLLQLFDQDILKAGQPDTKFLIVGNLIHHDSLLANLNKRGMFDRQEHKALISWPKYMDLWEEWVSLYRGIGVIDDSSKTKAAEFYTAHKTEMDIGGVSSWPDRWPVYALMESYATGGRGAFLIEMQQEALGDAQQHFAKLKMFRFEEKQGRRILIPSDGSSAVPLIDCTIIGAADPSLGRTTGADPDPSALIVLAKAPDSRQFVLHADIRVRTPDEIMLDQENLARKYVFTVFGIESVQFQAFFAARSLTESFSRGVILPVVEVKQSSSAGNTQARVLGIEPLTERGLILFNEVGCEMLINQLREITTDGHDDGPAALEIAVRLAAGLSAMPSEGESITVETTPVKSDELVKQFRPRPSYMPRKPKPMKDDGGRFVPQMVR